MSKFTKGRWLFSGVTYQVIAYPDEVGTWEKDAGGCRVYPDGRYWHEITGELLGSDEDEILANGRLMASAPKMYEFLKWYVEDDLNANTRPKTTQQVKELLAYIECGRLGEQA